MANGRRDVGKSGMTDGQATRPGMALPASFMLSFPLTQSALKE